MSKSSFEQEPGQAPGQPSYLLRWHAAVVISLLVVFGVLLALHPPGSPGGANIGAGIALLPLLLLGVPWTLPFLISPYSFDPLPTAVILLIQLGPALLNLGIHAGIARRRRR